MTMKEILFRYVYFLLLAGADASYYSAVLFVLCTLMLARLADAWGCLIRWAQPVSLRTLAHSGCRWIPEVLSVVVVWVDGVLSPFKLGDWQDRALAAEAAVASTTVAQ